MEMGAEVPEVFVSVPAFSFADQAVPRYPSAPQEGAACLPFAHPVPKAPAARRGDAQDLALLVKLERRREPPGEGGGRGAIVLGCAWDHRVLVGAKGQGEDEKGPHA